MKLSKERRSGKAIKGSQFHLQNLIDKNPKLLNKQILNANSKLRNVIEGDIEWVSPLKQLNYLEFQDKEFLEAIGYSQLGGDLLRFWPEGGPVWDALATLSIKSNGKNGIILLEAKSHIRELISVGCGAQDESKGLIIRAFKEVQDAIGITYNDKWLDQHYQYANRLAHLYFLLIKEKIPTWLVFLYFLGDIEQNDPVDKEGWYQVIDDIKKALRLPPQHILSDNIIDVFFDISNLTK